MFDYLKGTIAGIGQGNMVVEVSGVGFLCATTLNTLSRVNSGDTATIYTYLHVREDILDLYGFFEPEERACFKMLINISGVGPKAALAILSAVTPQQLALCVVTGDEKPLTAASGVGKKLAARVVLELKDKIAKDSLDARAVSNVEIPQDTLGEATAALAVLGYSQGEIALAMRGVDASDMTVEQLVKTALTALMR